MPPASLPGRRCALTAVAAVAAVALAAALTACQGSVAGHGHASSAPGSGAGSSTPKAPATSSGSAVRPVPSSGPSSGAAALGAVLERIAIHRADLAPQLSIALIQGGDQVAGQVTLENCGFTFSTERHRVARRQYGITDSSHPTQSILANELVAYDSTAEATRAVAEWRRSAATCPHRPVTPSVAGEPDLLFKVSRITAHAAGIPAAINIVTTETASAQGRTLYNVSILQAHGRFLDNIYLTAAQPITRSGLAAATHLAQVTGRRLVAQR